MSPGRSNRRQTPAVRRPWWPLSDLRVRTPRLELRAIDDDVLMELADLAANGVHDPALMPFGVEWTDLPEPSLQIAFVQYHWRCRADVTPAAWRLELAVFEGDELVGAAAIMAERFATLRSFETGSWLGIDHHGQGLGTEVRVAMLHLGFVGLGADEATTTAFADNAASLAVTRKLGYEPNGDSLRVRRGVPARSLRYRMEHDWFDEHVRRDDIELVGVDACLPLLGLS